MDNNWQTELSEYIRQGEPDEKEKTGIWQTAIGLQAVDGLKTSEYLLQTAKEHIEGKIDIVEVKNRIKTYYETQSAKEIIDTGTMEADNVSARITEILEEKTFQFSPVELKNIHKRLFSGIYKNAGVYRNYNITKKEWVLNGKTVFYAAYETIKDTIDYDFKIEKEFSYTGMNITEAIKHITQFTSNIWQIHPFEEGNTRSTAVFIIKYLRTFGFDIDNTIFANNSWYFRNALVRANYNDLRNNIHSTTQYLELFFENILVGTKHELKNRYLHLDYPSIISENLKCQNGTLNDTLNGTLKCSLDELAILRKIIQNPKITQKELAEATKQSERTIKRKTTELQNKGYIKRTGAKKNGQWEVLVEIKD